MYTLSVLLAGAAIWWVLLRGSNGPEIEHRTSSTSIVSTHYTDSIEWIPIQWESDETSDRAAMYLPVYLDTISKPLLFQFDLGSPYSLCYNVSNVFPALKIAEQQKALKTGDGQWLNAYSNISLRLGTKGCYNATLLPIFAQVVYDSIAEKDSQYIDKIGTLGYDAIEGRILIIDFIHSRVAITDSLPVSMVSKLHVIPGALVSNDPIYLPIQIGSERKLMRYDNGSSAFTIITDTILWNKWRNPTIEIDTFEGNSWGKAIDLLRSPSLVPIHFLDIQFTRPPIWSRRDYNPQSYKEVFNGDIGNEFFRNQIVVFDTKHNVFGILKDR